MPAETRDIPLVLKFGGSLVEQLGAQLYPSVTAAVAELVSNAWDADARHVWITLPFDDWQSGAEIEVVDDGHGMTRAQAQDRYLIVGRNRRAEEPTGDKSEGGRLLHGRKGIGKLAAFGTAGYLECVTVRDGKLTAFGIDYDKVRRHRPTDDYETETVDDPSTLTDPISGGNLLHGTRIRLTKLHAKRRPNEAQFRRSMARRFALSASQMQVLINGEALQRFDYDVEIRFPRDAVPTNAKIHVDDDGWAVEAIPYGDEKRTLRWWIGFTASPVPDEDVRGISVLARGKLVQRPFMFETAQGTTGQLGQEYLVGEVEADWLDRGMSSEQDLIQSNRDQLQLDNEELEPFLIWGRERLRWALAERNRLRRDRRAGAAALGENVDRLLRDAPSATRRRLRTLAGRLAELTDERGVEKALTAVIETQESEVLRAVAESLALDGDPDNERTWDLLQEADHAVADGLEARVRTRIAALEQFLLAVAEPPAPRLHRELASAPWIVSPSLELTARTPVEVDDGRAVVRFAALPPVVPALTVIAYEVGPEVDETDVVPELEGGDSMSYVLVASSWVNGRASPRQQFVTWRALLEMSIEAHQAWARLLREVAPT